MGIAGMWGCRIRSIAAREPRGRWLSAILAAAGLLAGCLGSDAARDTELPAGLAVHAPPRAEPAAGIQLSSSAAALGGIRFLWDFGDGSTSSEPAPVHRYLQPGRYLLSLQISNTAGQSRSAQTEVRIGRFAALQDARCSGADRSGWCQQWPLEGAREITRLAYLGNTQVFGAGSDGRIYYTRSDSPSSVWQEASLDTPARMVSQITFADAQIGWAVGITALPEPIPGTDIPGRAVLLLKTTDAGRSWLRQDLKEAASATKWPAPSAELKVLDRSRLLLTHRAGKLRWVSSDGGNNWTAITWPQAALQNLALIDPRSGSSVWSLGVDPATQDWVLARSRDLGITFELTTLRLPASALVASVKFADDLHGWVMTSIPNADPRLVQPERETFWSTSDGGATWTHLGGEGLVRGVLFDQPPAVEFLDGSRGIAGNSVCGMQKVFSFKRTLDGGRTWQSIAGPAGRLFQDLTAISASVAWTTGQSRCGLAPPDPPPRRGIFLTRNLGQSWQYLDVADEPADSEPVEVRIAEDQSIHLRFAAQTYRSADDGGSWTRIWPAQTTSFEARAGRFAIFFATPSSGSAMSASGRLLRSADGGRTWQAQAAEGSGYPQLSGGQSTADQRGRIQLIDADRAWVAGREAIYLVSNGGASWVRALSTSTSRDLWFADSMRGWVIRASGYDASTDPADIWSTTDAGQSWQQQARFDFAPNGLHFADRMLGLVVGEGGAILRTTNGGASWSRQASGTVHELHRVRFADSSTAWAVGAPGAGVRVSRDGGLSWQPVLVGSPHAWNGVHFVDAQRGWLVGDFGRIASTRDGGRSWQIQQSGTSEHLFDVFGIDAETAWTIGERGVIRATATGGD